MAQVWRSEDSLKKLVFFYQMSPRLSGLVVGTFIHRVIPLPIICDALKL